MSRASLESDQEPDTASLRAIWSHDIDGLVDQPEWLIGGRGSEFATLPGLSARDYDRVFGPAVADWSRRVTSTTSLRSGVTRLSTDSTRGHRRPSIDAFSNRISTISPSSPAPRRAAAIADYLDRETARIDTLIEEQQRLIEMLRERRDALSSSRFRRRPGRFLGDRRSTWWPTSPSGRPVVQLRRITVHRRRTTSRRATWRRGDMFIWRANIKADRWIIRRRRIDRAEDFAEWLQASRPEVGDVSFIEGGTTGMSRGVADLDRALRRLEFACGARSTQNSWIRTTFAYASAQPCYESVALVTRDQRTIDSGVTRMANIELPLPATRRAAARAVAHLDEQTAKIDTLIAETERFIELARERRSALITAAVTGQIDVRAAEPARWPEMAQHNEIEFEKEICEHLAAQRLALLPD